jgi:N-dimethylarginine dimethylaminohydrolase
MSLLQILLWKGGLMWPKNVLLVSPDHFDITYAINPYMREESGQLKTIDRTLAEQQWKTLRRSYQELGLHVTTIEGGKDLPDMIFAANQTFPFFKSGKKQFVISRMKSPLRQNEVTYFKQWLSGQNIEFYETPEDLTFEGMGDALWNYDTDEIFGGHGFRTDPLVYEWLSELTGRPVVRLHLVSEKFYHLDTALAILNANTALVVREAFSPESFEKLQMKFKNLLLVPLAEAESCLAANVCSVDGRNVFVEKKAKTVQKKLRDFGFQIHQFDTSEFIKAGGSIFCLKLLY